MYHAKLINIAVNAYLLNSASQADIYDHRQNIMHEATYSAHTTFQLGQKEAQQRIASELINANH